MKPRWITETKDGHSQWYIERFRQMAAAGADLEGEARFMDTLVAPGSKILDGGCGPGRIAGALHRRGHDVTGVDVDPELIEAAQHDHPGPRYFVDDLSRFDLGEQFDAIVVAGNVMVFVAPETEPWVLGRLAAHTKPGGKVVIGCRLDRGYGVRAMDLDATNAGLEVHQRFATWDLEPFSDDADFAVTVYRKPE